MKYEIFVNDETGELIDKAECKEEIKAIEKVKEFNAKYEDASTTVHEDGDEIIPEWYSENGLNSPY